MLLVCLICLFTRWSDIDTGERCTFAMYYNVYMVRCLIKLCKLCTLRARYGTWQDDGGVFFRCCPEWSREQQSANKIANESVTESTVLFPVNAKLRLRGLASKKVDVPYFLLSVEIKRWSVFINEEGETHGWIWKTLGGASEDTRRLISSMWTLCFENWRQCPWFPVLNGQNVRVSVCVFEFNSSCRSSLWRKITEGICSFLHCDPETDYKRHFQPKC